MELTNEKANKLGEVGNKIPEVDNIREEAANIHENVANKVVRLVQEVINIMDFSLKNGILKKQALFLPNTGFIFLLQKRILENKISNVANIQINRLISHPNWTIKWYQWKKVEIAPDFDL